MPSEKFLVAVTGTIPVGANETQKRLQQAVENAVVGLQPFGVYIETMRLAFGAESTIIASVESGAGGGE
jgi:hypothetical protein